MLWIKPDLTHLYPLPSPCIVAQVPDAAPFSNRKPLLQGLSSALDTLGSQAYGANNRAGVISWSVTTTLVMSVLAVPMAVVLYFGDALAIHIFQQPREIADVRLPHMIPECRMGPCLCSNLRQSAILVFCHYSEGVQRVSAQVISESLCVCSWWPSTARA